ncbi:hypothetical protein [Alkalihalobacillus deserti]|uniref:hypothetical protein n=1 Tax=Alkalihalobacillus deserti TaxID=2879466 RepID=UPI001D143027|nr:hypothetical protein [Alkalihalobacillus deserti]
MQCKVKNGYAEIGDQIKVLGYIDQTGTFRMDQYYNGIEYIVTGFKEYEGEMEILYKRLPPVNHPRQLEMIEYTRFSHSPQIIEIIKKRETFWSKLIKKYFNS